MDFFAKLANFTIPSGRTLAPMALMALMAYIALTPTTHAQSQEIVGTGQLPNEQNEQSPKGTPVVFETMKSIKTMEPGAIVSKTFYYSNANDDPASTPTTGEDDGIKYIKISATEGNPSKMSDTVYKLDRWVKIPENAPRTINIEFKSKITKNKEFEWLTTPGSKEPEKRNKVVIDFMKENGESGGGKKIESNKLKTIDEWVTHNYNITIPTEAKYLHIGLETSGSYSLWLGDWTIK